MCIYISLKKVFFSRPTTDVDPGTCYEITFTLEPEISMGRYFVLL